MKSKQIKLSSIHDALEFVSAAEACDFNVDVRFNRIIVDGKSLIGVCSIDLNHILSVSYDGENTIFEHILEKYQAA